MDTSSPFFAPASPVELERKPQVTLSQLLQHVRSSDQRDAFLRDVIFNSPAPSVVSGSSSRRSSEASSRRSKRAGLILVTDQIKVWSDDEDEGDPRASITSSSLASFNGWKGAKALHDHHHHSIFDPPSVCNRSPQSGWWDEGTDSDDESPSISVMACVPALTPSRRSIENMKTFDPSFSFDRRCLTSPVDPVDPLSNWFAIQTIHMEHKTL